MQEEMRRKTPEDFCVEEMMETQFPYGEIADKYAEEFIAP